MDQIKTIEWIDSSASPAWDSKDGWKVWGDRAYNTSCVTIGIILHETDEYIISCSSYDGESEYGGCHMIPKTLIRTIQCDD